VGYEGDRLPDGNWTVGFHLYQAEGFDSMPVRVIGIKSEGDRGLTGVRLQNRSAKAVTAVRIGWYVSTEGGPGTILARGETPLLAPPLHANESVQLSIPPISLAKILKPAVKRNTLRGDFSVQVAVTEIVYEDGSTWKFSQPANVTPIKVQYAHAPQGGCGQICRWIPALGYVCESVQQNVRCIVFGESCIVESCDSGGN
ncbi:MAG TPA: hypothetical protein VFP64_05085, partial [Pyrinomonadaceae bacterium]|nr:hypothetical protein [Pyrinomonadaceae bacterium]